MPFQMEKCLVTCSYTVTGMLLCQSVESNLISRRIILSLYFSFSLAVFLLPSPLLMCWFTKCAFWFISAVLQAYSLLHHVVLYSFIFISHEETGRCIHHSLPCLQVASRHSLSEPPLAPTCWAFVPSGG